MTRTEISTPEQVNLRLEFAGLGSRSMAFMIDLLILYGVQMFLLVLAGLILRGVFFEWLASVENLLFALLIFAMFVVQWGYFVYFEWRWNGQTPGKKMLGIRVLSDMAEPLNSIQAVTRNLVRQIECVLLPPIGLLAIFFNHRSQRLGDLLAQTIVVREEKIDWSLFDLPDPSEDAEPPRIAPVMPMSPTEIELLQSYIRRRDELDPEKRDAIRAQVVLALARHLPRSYDNADAALSELLRSHSASR